MNSEDLYWDRKIGQSVKMMLIIVSRNHD